jgi:monoamine oxidase
VFIKIAQFAILTKNFFMTTRREFLKQASLIAAGAAVPLNSFGINLISKKKVVIIGAGFAGLACALKLRNSGFDVTVIEARKRTGGRVFSYKPEGNQSLVIELGAEWIGASHERIISMCKAYGIEIEDNTFNDRLVYDNKFYRPDEWSYSPEWKEKFDRIIADYGKMTEAQKKKLDKTDWWRYLVNSGISGRDLDIREYADSTDFGESIRFVSAFAALAEYAESSARNEMDFKAKGGNSRIIEALANDFGMNNIRLGKRVTSVKQGSKVDVLCNDGDHFECDYLVCTAPIYSLMKINWEPALSPEKTDALNSLQYARINKCATLFSKRFWDEEGYSILTDTFSHYFYHATKNQAEQNGVLISYSIGDKADMFSRMSKEQRIRTISASLELPAGDVSNFVIDNINYYWGSDEYSMGAYALYGKGQWFGTMPILKEKEGKIYFAGEHLADWQGFMEGAVNSGEEVAESILGS